MKMRSLRVLAAMLMLAGVAASAAESDKDDLNLGLTVTTEATTKDVGLPAYPGSRPYEEGDDDDNAARVAISTPLFGLKVVAVELEVGDEPGRVAAFYKKALSRYGQVLECRDGSAVGDQPSRSGGDELKCDPGDSRTHGVVYKVGTESNQRIVAVNPHGRGTQFSLVHLQTRDESD